MDLDRALAELRPGMPILIGCGECDRDDAAEQIYRALKPKLNPSGRNAADLVRCAAQADDSPEAFGALERLYVAILNAAGFRDQFEGLLLVEADPLVRSRQADPRAKALAEALEVWAPRAYCAVFAPPERESLLALADAMDLYGKLRVAEVRADRARADARDIGAALDGLRLESTGEAREALERIARRICAAAEFSATRMLASIAGGEAVITPEKVAAACADEFSYINRVARAAGRENGARRIGFRAGEGEKGRGSECIWSDI